MFSFRKSEKKEITEKKGITEKTEKTDISNLYNKEGTFSDISFELTNGKIILLHKNIISLCSQVFKVMFNTQMKEKDQSIIKLTDDPTSLELMFQFMYDFPKIFITSENSVGLFAVAHKYEYIPLCVQCSNFINQNANYTNCCRLFDFSKTYDLKDLKEKCFGIIQSYFTSIKDFDILEINDVKEIIPKVHYHGQINIFKKILEWITHDIKERECHIFTLLDLLDYSQIENDVILTMGDNVSFLKENDKFKIFIYDTLKKKLKQEELKLFPISSLITDDDFKLLEKWINKSGNKWKLLYKASKDGWGSIDFHKNCDNQGETITVFKATNGYIFGGYNPQPWTSNSVYTNDMNTFLFSLYNANGFNPTIIPSIAGKGTSTYGNSK